MPPVGFEPAIPESERQQTYAFDRLTTVTNAMFLVVYKWNVHVEPG